jgi:hypothetical protein
MKQKVKKDETTREELLAVLRYEEVFRLELIAAIDRLTEAVRDLKK